MNTETLIEAISFMNSDESVRKYIHEFEMPPKEFEIFQISATVQSYQLNIVRVLINFAKIKSSHVLKEDVFIDVQGTNLTNFKIIKKAPVHSYP